MASEIEHTSPFLSLPPELRNNIYRTVLKGESEHLEIEPSQTPKHTSILSVCRQVRSEANAIFYAENSFHTTLANESAKALLTWLSSIGRTNVKLLTKVVIEVDSHSIDESVIYEIGDAIKTLDDEGSAAVVRCRIGLVMVDLANSILATGCLAESVEVVCEKTEHQEESAFAKVFGMIVEYQASLLEKAIKDVDKTKQPHGPLGE